MQQYNSIFFVGIKGVAMANLALICREKGIDVSGSDLSEEFITDHELSEKDIKIVYSFDATALPHDVELVVYSAAHGGDKNPQVVEALNRGIKVVHQAIFIGDLLSIYKHTIAVAGCHGKTTTSGLLAYALSTMDEKPGYMVGVSEFNEMPGGAAGKSDYFVVEADEYALNPPADKTPKFHFIHPTHALITNIDFDHPDIYENIEDTKDAFKTFIDNVKSVTIPSIVVCADDEHTMSIIKECDLDRYVTYGLSPESDVKISNIKTINTGMQFTLTSTCLDINESFTISLFGEKNVLNATGAIVLLRICNFSLTQIQTAIEGYTGAKRRFELVEHIRESYIFDDYAHHPAEISSTIQAARARFPENRLIVIFQPHTFTRTESLKNEFIEALSKADMSLVLPIFGSAREKISTDAITSKELQLLAEAKGLKNIHGFDSKKESIEYLEKGFKNGDVIFTMGAGDVYKLKSELQLILEK